MRASRSRANTTPRPAIPSATGSSAVTGSFHGRTLATLAAAGNEKYLKGFGPPAPGFDHVAYGNLNEMRAAVGPETAGIIVEPVQGEGGLRRGARSYLKGLRAICDEFGLLLVFDEVQSGMGRTGKLFAHEWAGRDARRDGAGQGLGGGFPVGACLATEKAAKGMSAGTHGSTFGGNPLAMAVANAVLDVMLEPGFFDAGRARGERACASGSSGPGQGPSQDLRRGARQGPAGRTSNASVVNADMVDAAAPATGC